MSIERFDDDSVTETHLLSLWVERPQSSPVETHTMLSSFSFLWKGMKGREITAMLIFIGEKPIMTKVLKIYVISRIHKSSLVSVLV